MKNKVSIITVVYNNISTIEDTIESVLKQSYSNIEYIIIDGGSTDGTIEKIKEYKNRIQVFISEPDKGIYDAMNKGIGLSTGYVVGFLHADDFFANKDVVLRIMEQFNDDNNVDAVYSDLLILDRENLSKVVRFWKSSDYVEGDFGKGWHPPHPTFYVKKEKYSNYGLYNINLRIVADVELMYRFFVNHKLRTRYIPMITVCMRTGGTSTKSFFTTFYVNYTLMKALRKIGYSVGIRYLIGRLSYRFFQKLRKPKIDYSPVNSNLLWFK